MKKRTILAPEMETVCSYNELFKQRMTTYQAKTILAEADPNTAQTQRLHKAIKLAEKNLVMLNFQCTHFHRLLETFFHSNKQIRLRHPKHPTEVFILQQKLPNSLELILIDETTKEDGTVENFEVKLKLARRLQDPTRTFDTFFELFGLPK